MTLAMSIIAFITTTIFPTLSTPFLLTHIIIITFDIFPLRSPGHRRWPIQLPVSPANHPHWWWSDCWTLCGWWGNTRLYGGRTAPAPINALNAGQAGVVSERYGTRYTPPMVYWTASYSTEQCIAFFCIALHCGAVFWIVQCSTVLYSIAYIMMHCSIRQLLVIE